MENSADTIRKLERRCREAEEKLERLKEAETREAHIKKVLLAIRNVNQLIVHETDTQCLIDKATEHLTETMGYINAWIALLGTDRKTVYKTGAYGFNGGFDTMREQLMRGMFPQCMYQALDQSDLIIVENPQSHCTGCDLSAEYGERAGMIRKLAYENNIFGVLAVSVPAGFAFDLEEQAFFTEVTDDLGFALHKTEMNALLAENQWNLQRAQKVAHVGSWIFDLNNNTVHASEEAHRIYGLEHAKWSIHQVQELALPHYRPMLDEAFKNLVDGTHPYDVEFEILRPTDSSIRHIHSIAEYNPEKNHIIGTIQDITSRKEIERALQKRKHFLTSIIQTAASGFWMIDTTGLISEVNEAYCKMTGYSRDEIIGMNIGDLDVDENPEDTAQHIERIIAGGSEIFETRHRRKDNSIFPVEITATFLPEHGGHFICFCTDLTERKAAENRLKRSEERNRLLSEVTMEGILIHENGIAIDVNTALSTMLGYERDELLNRNFIAFVHEDDMELVNKNIVKDRCAPYSIRMQKRNGEYFYVEIESRNIENENGKFRVTAIRDITERKKTEEELRLQALVLDQIADLVTVTDLEGKITYVNKAELQVLGYSREELVGSKTSRYGEDAQYGATQREILDETLKNGHWRGEVVNQTSDGRDIIMDCRTQVVYDSDGNAVALCGVSTDITERTHTEEALRSANETMKLAADSAEFGIWNYDILNNSFEWDDWMFRLYGIDRDDFDNTYEAWQNTLHPDELNRAKEELQLAIHGKKDIDTEFRIIHGDGTVRHLRVHATVTYDENGNPVSLTGINYDITTRKKAEEELYRKSEAMESSSQGMAILADDQTYIYLNKAHAEIYGYSDPAELIGKSWQVLYNHDERERFLGEIMPVFVRDGFWSGEGIGMKKDGTTFPQEVSLSALKGGGLICVVQNISERIKATDALRASEERFQKMLSVVPDMISIHDTDMNILYSNWQGFAAIPEEKRKRNTKCYETYRNLEHICPDCRVKEVLETREALQVYAQPREGQWLDIRIIPLLNADGTVDTFMEWVRDITTQKQAEEALEKRILTLTQPLEGSESVTLEDLFDINELQYLQDQFAAATNVASLIINVDGSAITKPSNFCRLCNDIIRKTEKGCVNCRKSDIQIGKHNTEGPTISPCTSGGLWDAGAAITVGGKHIASWLVGQIRNEAQSEENMKAYAREIGADVDEFMEAYYEVPEMSKKEFEQIAQTLFTLTKQLSGIAYQNIKQARFINEIKQANEERIKLQEQLTQAQKMESIGRLAGGVAHDFNNMLSVIAGNAELALLELDKSGPLYTEISEIMSAAERSADLTRQLLAFARKQTVAPKVLDLNETIESMLKMLRRLIGEDIELTWKPGQALDHVRIDPSQIDQMLANLLLNARDAINHGGGKVMIETHHTKFDREYCQVHREVEEGKYVMVAVSDNGCGMSKEVADNIFEPFYTTKSQGKGTGLGLATVYGIVKQNNGFINVYSEPGHGTAFKVYFPAYDKRHTSNSENGETQRTAKQGNEVILIVEDEPAILSMGATMLERLGYSVLSAPTPEKAVNIADEYRGRIDLLITDVIMPEMNGHDLAKRLLSVYPDLKLLFMSGYTADVIANQGMLDEGVNFIQKPFSLNDLGDKVRGCLD